MIGIFSDCKEIGEISFTVNDLMSPRKVSYIFVDVKSGFIGDGCLLERGFITKHSESEKRVFPFAL